MAIATAAFTTYTAIGNREDLSDIIKNISPVDTFFTSNTGDTDAKARYHEWQTDALAAAAANAQIEGDDSMAATAVTPTGRAGNYTQILRKVWTITETQEVVEKAGRKSEQAYQAQKNLKELATDIEYALVINAAAASGATGTARTLKGALGWITTNVSSASATGLDLTETLYNDNLALIWAQGGRPQHTLCGAYQKRKISAFTANSTRFNDTEKSGKNTLQAAVDVYKSDFGAINIHLHYIMNAAAASVVLNLGDMNLWNKAWLRRPAVKELAKTGDATKKMAIAELTLASLQEKGAGQITANKSS